MLVEGTGIQAGSIISSIGSGQITLDKTIQDDPYVLKVVDEGKIKTRNLGGPMEDPHRWHNH